MELIREASVPFDITRNLAGQQASVFFGSAINNFGVQEILQALVEWAPPPHRDGNTVFLNAVGKLQFEIVAYRLSSEYNVDATYETVEIHTTHWLTFPDDATRRRFGIDEAASLGKDVDGNPVFLARTEVQPEARPGTVAHRGLPRHTGARGAARCWCLRPVVLQPLRGVSW